MKRKCATFISQASFSNTFHDNIKYIAVVTASKQTCGNFEVRCPHLFGILLQRRLQASIKCIFLGSDSKRFFIELDKNIRSIYGAYTCIYGAYFPYTEHIRSIFLHIRAYTGPFFAYTEHIRGTFLHIRSIYGAFFCIYGAYTEHIRAYTCIYGKFFPDTEQIRAIYEQIRYVLEKILLL